MNNLQSVTELAWENRELLKDEVTLKTVREDNALLEAGTLTVAKPIASGVPCALIIEIKKPSTDLKTSLNNTLREYDVAV